MAMSVVTVVLLILCLVFVCFLVVLGVKALREKAVSGAEGLLGKTGKVIKTLEPEGIVYVSREDFTAISKHGATIEVGANVKVVAIDGVKIVVEKIK
ncbi:MAG: hypothetical protein NTX32_04445 [Candidatus Firestonebacteria bacterium]|jgi:membrane-bound serine protease (ClpP class)|nr:hypothetical protein [Candidatus Firestonebacteria bacterium]